MPELALDQCGRLISRPAREYKQLRMTPYTEKDLTLNAGERLSLLVSGRQLEVVLTVQRGKGVFELGIAASPDETEVTLLGCDPQTGKVWLDTTRSSLSNEVMTGVQEISVPNPEEEYVQLRVILDGSVIKVWVDDAFSLSGRIYPTLGSSQTVYMAAKQENIRISDLSACQLGSIWKEN